MKLIRYTWKLLVVVIDEFLELALAVARPGESKGAAIIGRAGCVPKVRIRHVALRCAARLSSKRRQICEAFT